MFDSCPLTMPIQGTQSVYTEANLAVHVTVDTSPTT